MLTLVTAFPSKTLEKLGRIHQPCFKTLLNMESTLHFR